MSADPVTAAIAVASTLARQQAQRRVAQAQIRATEQSAADARSQAEVEAEDLRRRNRLQLGRQRTLIAKSGVKLEGTPLLAQEDTAAQGEADALARLDAGESRAASLLGRANQIRIGKSGFPLFR